MFHQILVPIDFEQSDAGLPSWVLELAEKHDAELHLLHVIHDRIWTRVAYRDKLQLARERLEQETISDHKITVRRTVQQGSLAESVIEYAKTTNVDLVALDETSSGITSERSFKATVNRLLESMDCPILVRRQRNTQTKPTEIMRKGADVLRNHFGHRVGGDHESTRQHMRTTLVQALSLSPPVADRLLADMEAAHIVVWHVAGGGADTNENPNGEWDICPSEDAKIDFTPNSAELEEDRSAAMGLLRRAITSRATDVHFDPGPADSYVVRFRIDGRVQEYCTMQNDVAGSVMKQLKVMANVDLADPFQPSESRLQLPSSITNFEVRITTAPVVKGQAIALRLIDCDKLYRPLTELGLSSTSFAAVYEMLHRRSGLVLIAGPTGAGKTTTAYSILNLLFTEQQNIVSIEDPVELLVPFMRQLGVDKRHGLTMDVALSTILRMDPDVLFVGEIRNAEAAKVAIQAAGCGKRAFSTMHMRDCSAAVTAMRKLDVDAKSLADNLSGIITQRLVRRLCGDCSQQGMTTKYERELFTTEHVEPPEQVLRPRGCSECRGTGYRGRIGIFEAVVVEGEVAEGMGRDEGEAEFREVIRQAGTPSLVAGGLSRVREGITSIEEIQELSWLPKSATTGPHHEPLYERGVPYNTKAL